MYTNIGKLRVLHIINSLETGGAEKLVLDTVPLLVKRGHTVNVLLLNGKETPFFKSLTVLGCCEIFVLGKSYYNPFYILAIGKYLSEYDIVHAHLFPTQYFSAFAKLFFSVKTKLVFTEHSTTNTRLAKPIFKSLERFIYRQYNKVICITSNVKEVLVDKLSIPSDTLCIIENGIKLDDIQMATSRHRSEFGYQKDDVLLIMVAGFRKEKDQDTVIKALQLLPANYHLILVGDGERRNELMNLVGRLNVLERVRFLGARSDVPRILKLANIAVLSSHWEGFGLAAAEAMAAGIPVVASNVPGLGQVVEGGGILFERENAEELAAILYRLITDRRLYLDTVNNGIQKAKQYDIEKMVMKTEELYHTLIKL